MRTFETWTNGGNRLECVVFSDGSVAVRRLSTDPCERITFTFEGISECEAEIDIKVPEPPSLGTANIALGAGEKMTLMPIFLPPADSACRLYQPEDNDPEPEDVEVLP